MEKTRARRTTVDQYKIFVAYLEQYEELRSGVGDAGSLAVLWNTMANDLNGYNGGPSRSVLAWKHVFYQWKCKVRMRRNRCIMLNKNSSVHRCTLPAHEVRALNAWNNVDGRNKGNHQWTQQKPCAVAAHTVDGNKGVINLDSPSWATPQYPSPSPMYPPQVQLPPVSYSGQVEQFMESGQEHAEVPQPTLLQINDTIRQMSDTVAEIVASMAQNQQAMYERLFANQEEQIAVLKVHIASQDRVIQMLTGEKEPQQSSAFQY